MSLSWRQPGLSPASQPRSIALRIPPPPNFVPVSRKKVTKQRDSSERKVKGFADDLTIINISKQGHKWALSEVDTKCSDLDLRIRPDKCVSLSFDGSKLDKSFIVPLRDGNTRNISDIGARFLGSILMGTPRSTNSSSSNTLITTFRASLQALDARPIRYRPLNTPPPNFVPVSHKKVTKQRDSSEHKVKGFADDLTIINISKQGPDLFEFEFELCTCK